MDGKDLRAEAYRQLNKAARQGQIVLAGSSLCEQFPVNELLMSMGQDIIVYNRGISGDTIPGYLRKLDACITPLQPSKLFLNIGTNDLNGHGFDPKEYEESYRNFLDTMIAKLPDAKVYVLAFYPMNEAVHYAQEWHSERTNARIDEANAIVKGICEEKGFVWINSNAGLKDACGELRAELTADGMHFFPDGYRTVLDVLLPYMLKD